VRRDGLARAGIVMLLAGAGAPLGCVFWDMGHWSARSGVSPDAASGPAASDAGDDAGDAGAHGPFCAGQDGAIFCADFDEAPTFGSGWSDHQLDNGLGGELDSVFFTTPPRSAHFTLHASPESCAYGYLRQDFPKAVQAPTLAFDIRAGEVDGGGIGSTSAPLVRERTCSGPDCASCSDDHCLGTSICYYLLQASPGATLVHEQVFPAAGGSERDISHPFQGADLEPGVWARVTMALDPTASTSALRVTLATNGGAPVTVLEDPIDPACAGVALEQMFIGYTCAPSDPAPQSVRFDNVLLTGR
jgi:hypothetical protein